MKTRLLAATSLSLFIITAICACGTTESDPFGLGSGAKGEDRQVAQSPYARPYGQPQKVTWPDGDKTKGAYVTAQVDYFPPELLRQYNQQRQVPELGEYLVEAYPDTAPPGHLNFFVAGDILFRLGAESILLSVDATVERGRPADYDLALFKFKCEYGDEEQTVDTCTEGYDKVVVPLDKAMGAVGVEITRTIGDSLISRLRSHGPYLNERYRAGFTGTWKVIVVPRNPSIRQQQQQNADELKIKGDPAVKINSVWITAEPMEVF